MECRKGGWQILTGVGNRSYEKVSLSDSWVGFKASEGSWQKADKASGVEYAACNKGIRCKSA